MSSDYDLMYGLIALIFNYTLFGFFFSPVRKTKEETAAFMSANL